MVDTGDLKSPGRESVRVRSPSLVFFHFITSYTQTNYKTKIKKQQTQKNKEIVLSGFFVAAICNLVETDTEK